MTNPALEMSDVTKSYGNDAAAPALNHLTLRVEHGEFVAVMGPSGSGKSTLLYAAAGLTAVSSGTVRVNGVELNGMSDRNLTALRRRRIGLIFQSFNLIPNLTVEENIKLPLLAGNETPDETEFRNLSERLGLVSKWKRYPGSLSGGEQQRAAIARALLPQPDLILADEPTGSLDSAAGRELCDVLAGLCREQGRTILLVTHEPAVALYADRILVLKDGAFAGDMNFGKNASLSELSAEYFRILERSGKE